MPLFRSLLVAVFFVSVAAADDLRTLDSRTITGTVVSMDDKEVAIKTSDGNVVATPLDNVIELKLRAVAGVPAGKAYIDIHLVDDTALMCAKFAIKGKTVEATLLSGQSITLPLASVSSILRGAENSKIKQAFTELLADKVKRDRVAIGSGEGKLNHLEGTIGDGNAAGDNIKFTTSDGDNLNVSLSKLQGIIFYRADAAATNPVCIVYDTAGNAIAAAKLLAQGGKVTIVTTVPNVTIQCDASTIARVDYNMGKLTFLSDLVPTKVIEKSGVGLLVKYRKDANLDGEPIVLDRNYPKGLSLHSHTELEYDLKGKYKKFTAVLGVDPRVGSDSQAKVTIEVDGRTAYSEVVTAKAVVPVTIDVTRASAIRIIVSSRNFLDLHDHVTIANPKVTQ